ncbi:siderophore-interacting protein [Sulfitobacter sp. LCG007]
MTMSQHIEFAHHAETALPGLDPSRLRAAMLANAREHGLDVVERGEDELALLTVYGRCTLATRAGSARVVLDSPRPDWLFVLKDSLTEQVAALYAGGDAALRWSDALPEGSPPPNFQFVEIRATQPLGPDFIRITVGVEDLSAFGEDAIHFRLALPVAGDAQPQWPHIGSSGATIWPKGDKALHRPVYTVRRIDAARGELAFDLFVHAGGRATAWARSVGIGTRVGLTGPGGGGIPETRKIALYADETGFPAVARILEALPADATGTALLSARDGAACEYPIPEHPGIDLRWRAGWTSTQLAECAIAEQPSQVHPFLWFAAEKTGATKLRNWCKSHGIEQRDRYVAAFWTQDSRTEGKTPR